MLGLFIAAFAMGLVFNVAPGAVFAETVRRGLRGGFRGALHVQLGSLVGDATWALLGLAGVGLLFQLEAVRWPLGVAGVLYLLWLARQSWKDAAHAADLPAPDRQAPVRGSALRAGMTLSLTNPQNIAFWAALGSALGAVGVSDPTPSQHAVFFAGFMAASVAWAYVCAALVVATLGRVSGGWVRAAYRLCALGFLVLALSSLHELVSRRGASAAPSDPAQRNFFTRSSTLGPPACAPLDTLMMLSVRSAPASSVA